MDWIANIILDECGAVAVEYALMLGLITLAVVGAVTYLGTALSSILQYMADQLPH